MDKLKGSALVQWLALRCRLLLAVAGSSSLFVLLALLSHTDTRPARYGAGLYLFLTLVWSVFDFLAFRRKSQNLAQVIQHFSLGIQALPEAHGLVEEGYQQLARTLYEDRASIISKVQQETGDREDYYTLWVHQIKTPIAALGLLLRSGEMTAETFAMEQELFKIEQYAEMALQYLRLENLSGDLLLRRYSLYDLVRQAVKKYSRAFIGKKLSLSLEEFDCPVITDEKWLSFVLEQILSNAIKYTVQGGIRIGMDPEQDHTLLIADTGIGIKAEDIPRIFDRGFTGYNGRMDKTSTGIGLYLCKQVARHLDLSITVTSTPGQGTCCRIAFLAASLQK